MAIDVHGMTANVAKWHIADGTYHGIAPTAVGHNVATFRTVDRTTGIHDGPDILAAVYLLGLAWFIWMVLVEAAATGPQVAGAALVGNDPGVLDTDPGLALGVCAIDALIARNFEFQGHLGVQMEQIWASSQHNVGTP